MSRDWWKLLYRIVKHRSIVCVFASTSLLSVIRLQAETRLVVNLEEKKVALISDGQLVKVYSVAIGKSSTPSPFGSFTVVSRMKQPTWYRPGKVVPPGKNNPLGTRWIGLSKSGYGIHGTNAPQSIGKAASHGCIRMRNADVEELFEHVSVGDVVELRQGGDPELARWFGTDEKQEPKALIASGQ